MEEGNLYKAPEADLSTSEGYFDKLHASKVASAQRVVILSLLAQILSIVIGMVVQVILTMNVSSDGTIESGFAAVLSYTLGLVFIISSIVLFFSMIVFTSYVYHFIFVILLIILMFIPVINLLVFLLVNIRANMILRTAGYHVGFLGARPIDN